MMLLFTGLVLMLLVAAAFAFTIPVINFLERSPMFMVGAVVALSVLAHALGGNLPAIGLGGISVYPQDIISVVFLALSFPLLFSRIKYGFKREDLPYLLLLGWAVFLFFNFFMGLRTYGLQTATNEFRGYLYFVCIALYLSGLNMRKEWLSIEKLWIYGAIALFFVAAYGYTDGDLSRQGRPVGAYATLFILQGFIVSLFLFYRGEISRYLLPFCVALLPMLLLLQHRTIWVVALLTLPLIFIFLPRMRPILYKWATIGGLFFGSIAVILFGEELFEAISDSYSEVFNTRTEQDTSTLVWRLSGWTQLLTGEQMDSPQEVLLGNPFGRGWSRNMVSSDGVELAVKKDVSPHNFYIQTVLRSGVLGLTLFICLHLVLVRSLANSVLANPGNNLNELCILIFLLTQMLFYLSYGADFVQPVLLGVAISYYRLIQQEAYSREGAPAFSDKLNLASN